MIEGTKDDQTVLGIYKMRTFTIEYRLSYLYIPCVPNTVMYLIEFLVFATKKEVRCNFIPFQTSFHFHFSSVFRRSNRPPVEQVNDTGFKKLTVHFHNRILHSDFIESSRRRVAPQRGMSEARRIKGKKSERNTVPAKKSIEKSRTTRIELRLQSRVSQGHRRRRR